MKEQFVTYQLALKLKELGFNEQCFAGYKEYGKDNIMLMMPSNKPFLYIDDFGYKEYSHQNKHVTKAPLWQQAFDWFRKKYKFKVGIGINDKGLYYDYKIVLFNTTDTYYKDCYNTYTEARLACLEKLIEIVETKKDSV